MRTWAACAIVAVLAGCATAPPPPPPPAVLVACEVDVTALYRCAVPAVLPSSPAEGLAVLWGALAACETAARSVIDQVERRAGSP